MTRDETASIAADILKTACDSERGSELIGLFSRPPGRPPDHNHPGTPLHQQKPPDDPEPCTTSCQPLDNRKGVPG
jgi:hypothetical protein